MKDHERSCHQPRLRRARRRRRPGRLDHLRAAGREGLEGDAAREGAPSALPHRRVAAADEPADPRAAGRARAGRMRSASRSPARTSTPTWRSRGTTSSTSRFALDKNHPYAYEVRRSEFDNLLLRNSAAKGTRVLEGVRVTRVEFPNDGDPVAHSVDEQGSERTWTCRFFVDASGRDTLLSRQFSLKRRTSSTPARRSSAISRTSSGARASTRATSACTGSSTAGSG